jgi:transcriptional regulator with XRE-family HTH domain
MTRRPVELRRPPRNDEEAAAFKGLGHTVTVIRERQDMTRNELAARSEMTTPELERIERGELDEGWGGLRVIAKAFGMPVGALMNEAEEFAPGPGGESWRRETRDAEAGSSIRAPRSDAAEARPRDSEPDEDRRG